MLKWRNTLDWIELREAHTPSSATSIGGLCRQIEAARIVLDRNLVKADPWVGPLRRETLGRLAAGEKERYVATFNWLTENAVHYPLTPDFVRDVHDRAVGGSDFRSRSVRVGRHVPHTFPAPDRVPILIDRMCAFLRETEMPLPVIAAYIHIGVVDIHPFRDGNGRTARLLASAYLIAHGYKSIVLTGMERYFEREPLEYIRLLDEYRFGRLSKHACARFLVSAAAKHAHLQAWSVASIDAEKPIMSSFTDVHDVRVPSCVPFGRDPANACHRKSTAVALEQRWTNHTTPFRHFRNAGLFPPDIYQALCDAFRTRVQTSRHTRAPNYDAAIFPLHTDEAAAAFSPIFSLAFLRQLATLCELPFCPFISAAIHRHPPGSRNGWIHTDFMNVWFHDNGASLIFPNSGKCDYFTGLAHGHDSKSTRLLRAALLIWFLENDDWSPGNGGYTALYKTPRSSPLLISPVSNSAILFRVSPHSYHRFLVSQRWRNSIVLWLHVRPEDSVFSPPSVRVGKRP